VASYALKLPSGRIVSTTYEDTTGRVKTVSSVLGSNSSTTYFNSPTYSPHGALLQATLGNGFIEQACFNARLQPVVLRQRMSAGGAADCSSQANRDNFDVLHLRYDYGSTPSSANTGNIATQTSTYGSKSFVQNYTYDGVNRLLTAIETVPGASWKQTYGYDAVGNRWLDTANNNSYGIALDPFTPIASTVFDSGNHMTGSGALYDGAGNQTDIGGYHYTYDAENRLTSSTITSSVNSATTTYSYNGDGRRVTKLSATGDWTFYVYDATGNLAAEYTSSSTRMACTLCYLKADHLGSIRMLTDASGTVKSLHDYLPFGEEIPSGTGGRDTTWAHLDPTQKFTGQERDAETGLDFFGARYFSGAQGRMTSPDEPLVDQRTSDPQSWNLYSYVRNNPLSRVDPNGQKCRRSVGQNGETIVQDADGNGCSDLSSPATVTASLEDIRVDQFVRLTARALDTQIKETRNIAISTYVSQVVGFGLGKFIFGPALRALIAARVARQAVQAATAAATGARAGRTWIAAYDVETGAIAVGHSGPVPNAAELHPDLLSAMDSAGGLGARNTGVAQPVGCCGEVDAANQLLQRGSKLENIRFTDAIRPRTGEVIPTCPNCRATFGR
jgi:RHS repeat-associated protein